MELQKGREELTRDEEEKAEKVRKEGGGRREVAVTVGITRRNKEIGTRPVTTDGEDGDQRMRYQDVTLISA